VTVGGGDESVSRHEFDLYRDSVRTQFHDGDRRITDLDRDLRDIAARHEKDVELLREQVKTGIQGIRTELQQVATERQKNREWTWTRLGLVVTTALALVEAYLQVRHR